MNFNQYELAKHAIILVCMNGMTDLNRINGVGFECMASDNVSLKPKYMKGEKLNEIFLKKTEYAINKTI